MILLSWSFVFALTSCHFLDLKGAKNDIEVGYLLLLLHAELRFESAIPVWIQHWIIQLAELGVGWWWRQREAGIIALSGTEEVLRSSWKDESNSNWRSYTDDNGGRCMEASRGIVDCYAELWVLSRPHKSSVKWRYQSTGILRAARLGGIINSWALSLFPREVCLSLFLSFSPSLHSILKHIYWKDCRIWPQ